MPRSLRILISLLVGTAVGYLIYASIHSTAFTARVCVDYQGRTSCRIAHGRTRDLAIRAAHDNACAQLTGGVTGAITCQQTPASSVHVAKE